LAELERRPDKESLARPVAVVLDVESVIGWEDSLGEDQ
jgi:hypothetical protein